VVDLIDEERAGHRIAQVLLLCVVLLCAEVLEAGGEEIPVVREGGRVDVAELLAPVYVVWSMMAKDSGC